MTPQHLQKLPIAQKDVQRVYFHPQAVMGYGALPCHVCVPSNARMPTLIILTQPTLQLRIRGVTASVCCSVRSAVVGSAQYTRFTFLEGRMPMMPTTALIMKDPMDEAITVGNISADCPWRYFLTVCVTVESYGACVGHAYPQRAYSWFRA